MLNELSAGEWVGLLAVMSTIIITFIGAYVRMATRLASLETEIKNLKEMRDDWRKFLLRLQDIE